ncbi:MAG: hypothetical protein OER04_15395, partial [Cyclobacteriaceae bacterium]|nr:hypothetical protein [Cyclobacteriaceae bacterium]
MIRLIFTTLVALGCGFTAIPMPGNITTALEEVKVINDSLRVNVLNHRAQQILDEDPATAATFAEQAKNLSEQLNYESGRIQSLIILGKANQAQKEYATGLDHYLQASKALENRRSHLQYADVLMEIGLLFKAWGAHERAIEYFENSYQLSRQITDTARQISLLTYLGETHILLNHKEQARSNYTLLLDLQKHRDDKRQVLMVLEQLADIYAQLGRREQA